MATKSKRIGVALGLMGALVGTRPLKGDPIYHGPPRRPGNSLPEGALGICPGASTDLSLIASLKSGWAISSPSDTNVRLVFSNQILACQEVDSMAREARETCSDAWTFMLTLPQEMWRQGTYELSSWENQYEERTAEPVPGAGCSGSCGTQASGGGGGNLKQGVLEIFDANEQCATGRITGLPTAQQPHRDFNGAFYAIRCEAGSS